MPKINTELRIQLNQELTEKGLVWGAKYYKRN